MMSASDEELKKFCHNIAWLRKYTGLSKKDMAKLLGIGVKSLTTIEAGQLPLWLGAGILFSVRKHFRIPPSMLFKVRLGEDEMN